MKSFRRKDGKAETPHGAPKDAPTCLSVALVESESASSGILQSLLSDQAEKTGASQSLTCANSGESAH